MWGSIICILLCFGSCVWSSNREKRSFKDSIVVKGSSGNDGIEKYQAFLNRLETAESKLESALSNFTAIQDGFANISKIVKKSEDRFELLTSKLRDVEMSVDTDENYWNFSATCGGIMVGQSGQISYAESFRLASSPARSSCVWTIRTNNRIRIQVILSSASPVEVTEFFISNDGTHTMKNTTLISTRSYMFKGPVILVSSLGRSVSLKYAGHGKLVHEDTEFRHYHFHNNTGAFILSSNAVVSSKKFKRIFTTVVVSNVTTSLIEIDLQLPKICGNSSLSMIIGGAGDKQVSNCCQEGSCPTQIRRYTLDGWFATIRSSLSFLPQNEDVNLTWQSKGNASSSINCGGLLMGKSGRITYKKYSTYANNERCVWVIYPFPKQTIMFSQFTSGFETTYDHLTVWEVDNADVRSTILTSSIITMSKIFTGRVVLLTFYTDTSVVRQGFDIAWEAIGPFDNTRSLDNEKILHNSFKHSLHNIKLQGKAFVFYVMTSTEWDASSINVNVVKKSGTNCHHSHLKLLGSSNGKLDLGTSTSTDLCTSTATAWNLTSMDGMSVMLLENKNSNANLQVDVSWEFALPATLELDSLNKCGGLIHGSSGRLSYKLDFAYDNGERCIWLIHSVNSAEINLRLIKDGFELCCDYLLINTIDATTGQINNTTFWLTRENNTRTFPGNLLIVTFRSDSSVPGRGFVLEFTGRGEINYPYKYKLIHREEVEGSLIYEERGLEMIWDEEEYEDDGLNEILVIAYSTPIETGEGSIALIFNVTVENTILGVDDNCKSDILNFYTTPSREGFTLAESYPKSECQKTLSGCGNCVSSKLVQNDTTPHTFSSMYRAFVAIYKPVKSSIIQNQTFHFHWDSSSGCGGVMLHDEGRIAYKLGSRYKNLEQCIWTINIPDATQIHFLLVSNGFELCCDNIILTTLDPSNGTLGTSTILKSESTSAVVEGPVVFVTFRSDASVTGDGFALIYSAMNENTTLSMETDFTTIEPSSSALPEYRYHHIHLRRRNSSFTYPSLSLKGLGPNEIVTLTFSPEPLKNESFLRYSTLITLTQFGLDFDTETCTSDSLRFYETLTRFTFNASNSYEVNIPDYNNCSSAALENNWTCQNCLANQTQDLVSIVYPAFIAIYKSVTNDSQAKQFKLEWVDSLRTAESTTTTERTYVGYG